MPALLLPSRTRFGMTILVAACLIPAASAWAQSAGEATGALPNTSTIGPDLARQVQDLALSTASGLQQPNEPPIRLEVELGSLDPRLKLAPCAKIEPFLPPGGKLLGRTRIGLRCLEGTRRWTVYWPLTVKAWTSGWITASALPAGTTITGAHLTAGEVDLAESPTAAPLQPLAAIGRTLTRPVTAGSPLRAADLRQRQWFAAGDTVRVVAGGAGFELSTDGQAMNPGIEGQRVRVRTEGGRTITGLAVGDRLVHADR
jgi:flagellar basal body P-ring formation protein FlgA